MAIYVYVATSLDGFIAGPNGEIDWLVQASGPDIGDGGFAEFMSGIDALVMGRKTFETVVGFGDWPYDKPVFVLSSTMTEIPESHRGKAEIIRGGVEAVVAQLQDKGHENLYVDGGRVVQAFLEKDLVDEMIITRVPILLGDGVPLFGPLPQRLAFAYRGSKKLGDALSQDSYSRIREDSD